MRHLELHVLQSFPVSCLNRDELNSPKTAVFGGVQRARHSSQSWKRPVRMLARELLPERFKGQRTRYIVEPLRAKFEAMGQSADDAMTSARALAADLATADEPNRTKTLFYATEGELAKLASAHSSLTGSARKKAIQGLLKSTPEDAADLALFGRMVASEYTVKLEGAAMFSHALSTHKVENDLDFFAAVDDNQPEGEAGTAHTSTLEFTSATFYRFAALNLDMLFDQDHLKVLPVDERRTVVKTFVEATLMAYPTARRNSMHATTLPTFVLGVVRERGHPIQLVNAFEQPIRAFGDKGLLKRSIEAMLKERKRLNDTWNLKEKLEEKWAAAISASDYPLDTEDVEKPSSTKDDAGPKANEPPQAGGVHTKTFDEFVTEAVQHVR